MKIHPLLNKYCKHVLKARVEVQRKDRQKGTWYWDYPAMITVCHDSYEKKHKTGYAHPPKGTKWHETLRIKLERLGNIGTHSSLGRHYITQVSDLDFS